MDSGAANHICNSFGLFDLIKPLDELIKVANGSSMRIIRQGSVTLLCKRPNGALPFLLQLKNVYFILACTVNLVLTSQLSQDLIVFNSEVPCLKAFSLKQALCSVTQISCYYALDATPGPKSTFLECISSNLDPIYLILSLLEHSLFL